MSYSFVLQFYYVRQYSHKTSKPRAGKVEYARLTFGIRLWKWLASSSPRLWKWLCNPVLQIVQPSLTDCATQSYRLCNCVLRLMEMVSKQFSPFMELLVQPSLTDCATASYGLWKWLASSSPHLWNCLCNPVLQIVQLRLTAYGNGWQAVLPFMEMVVQPCLTVCITASYGLWKWLASSSPIYGNGFRSGTSENQRLHKELSNSKNRVTYRLR